MEVTRLKGGVRRGYLNEVHSERVQHQKVVDETKKRV